MRAPASSTAGIVTRPGLSCKSTTASLHPERDAQLLSKSHKSIECKAAQKAAVDRNLSTNTTGHGKRPGSRCQ